MIDKIRSAEIVLLCVNFDESLRFFTGRLGFRLEMIVPADQPAAAVISGYGTTLRLERSQSSFPAMLRLYGDFSSKLEREMTSPDGVKIIFVNEREESKILEILPEFVLTRSGDENGWHAGRAGMLYRDLIPSRLGGAVVASHISIPTGGPVADYVHYHKIRFQLIYCLSGWARLVYEDLSEPFLMKAGDCVLQPPEIRHQVLETSDKFEVLELGSPAIHETFVDHEMSLPSRQIDGDRLFSGQRFLHHRAENADWHSSGESGQHFCETGIMAASDGAVDVKIYRTAYSSRFTFTHRSKFVFCFVTQGSIRFDAAECELKPADCCTLLPNMPFHLDAGEGSEFIIVRAF